MNLDALTRTAVKTTQDARKVVTTSAGGMKVRSGLQAGTTPYAVNFTNYRGVYAS